MPVNASQLADEITIAMGQSLPAPAQIHAFASGLMDGLTSATAIVSGNIVGISPSTITSEIQSGAGYPSITPQLAGFGAAFALYVMASGIVVPSPPVPPSGPILGLTGSAYAAAIAASSGFPSVTPELLGFATAVTDHITNNALVVLGVIT